MMSHYIGLVQRVKGYGSAILQHRSQLQLRFDPWPGDYAGICCRAAKKEKKKVTQWIEALSEFIFVELF